MNLNSQTKTLLAVAVVLLLIYFMYNYNSPVQNEGSVEMEAPVEESMSLPENIEEDANSEISVDSNGDAVGVPGTPAPGSNNGGVVDSDSVPAKYNNIPIPREDMIRYFPSSDYAPPESDFLSRKFNSRNKARRGFKRSSYSGAKRGNLGPSDWDDYFDHNNNVIGNSQTGENDKFLPVDESNGNFAVFKSRGRAPCGSNQNCEPEDLYDVHKLLPQEVNGDWFDVQPEPISVKNRHLINITKPIGVNTIGTSKKNMSHDIRGTPAAPKFVVSPWLGSSIEPDTNFKPLY